MIIVLGFLTFPLDYNNLAIWRFLISCTLQRRLKTSQQLLSKIKLQIFGRMEKNGFNLPRR